ncbi:uncharacterized protein LOC129739348 isoform X2 [Uranotaenia lowii]|uniref:uncharacterized protein LOC129739348 isoform X2 n=1 Tax=Uranotaenia lowii TaxID=190385 RepID=UPI00247885EA|nr:uncharacterized protein LOC129739348 isoform X2 [Uranotaenia lowii]
MPRKVPIRTLSELALTAVAGSIVNAIGNTLQNSFSFELDPDITIVMVEINSYLENMGATSSIYEDLLRVILSSDALEGSIRLCCMQMLLNEGVHTLATDMFHLSYYERILQTLARQGRGLRQLNMKGVWIKDDMMCFMFEVVKHLSHLTKLTVPHIANDDLLKHIADYSKYMRQLDISGDTDITEIGLEYLCYGECRNNLTVIDIGSLGEENICHTDIALLLMNLPNLVSLASYSFVGRSLCHILEDKDPAFKCKLVYLHDTATKGKTLDAIISTCPKLVDIYLDYPEAGILQKLKAVSLKRLKLYKFSCVELLSLLEPKGDILRHLTLIKGRGTLEVHNLIRCSPNLVDLDFYLMDSLTFSGDRGFHDLQGLEILSSPISQTGLLDLLSHNTSLKRIAIDSVPFTDEEFCNLLVEKDFYQLEDIWFTTAPHMTMASIEMLMDRCPELQSLGQLSGWSMNPDDVTLLRGILKSCNASLMVQSL